MAEKIFNELLATLPDGKVVDVSIGLNWTAVVMEIEGKYRCGLASTLSNEHHHGPRDAPQAGEYGKFSGIELAALVISDQPTLTSVGAAAINALLPQQPDSWLDLNAEQVIAEHGADQSVALIGHFPFADRLRPRVRKLMVMELNPQPGDLPAFAAADVLPEAQVVAITGMTLLNSTLEELLQLCQPAALVILIGPSVPLSPIFFDHGVDILCGSVVTSIDRVLAAVRQGANFRQVHKAGVRLVTITKPDLLF